MNGHGRATARESPRPPATLQLKVINTLKAHTNDVTSVQWSGGVLASGSADKTVRVWRAVSKDAVANGSGAAGSPTMELEEMSYSPMREHYYHVQCLHFSSFGNTLATCATDGKVVLWDTAVGTQLASVSFPSSTLTALRCCRISSDGRLVAAGGDADAVALWSFDRVQGLRLLKVFYGHEATVTCICFSHDGAFLISGSSGADIRVWDCLNLQDQALCVWRDAHDLGCTCMDIAAYKVNKSNGDSAFHVATGGYDNLIKLWHITERKPGRSSNTKLLPGGTALNGHSADVCSVRFANQTKRLISCSSDRTFIVWDPIHAVALKRVGPLTKYVRSCCFSSDDKFVMAGFSGGLIGFWRLFMAGGGEDDMEPSVQCLTIGCGLKERGSPLQFLNDANAPEEFICPITQEVMHEPMVAEDGISYEKSAILLWLQKHDTSPNTNLVLRSKTLFPNRNLKALINRWTANVDASDA